LASSNRETLVIKQTTMDFDKREQPNTSKRRPTALWIEAADCARLSEIQDQTLRHLWNTYRSLGNHSMLTLEDPGLDELSFWDKTLFILELSQKLDEEVPVMAENHREAGPVIQDLMRQNSLCREGVLAADIQPAGIGDEWSVGPHRSTPYSFVHPSCFPRALG
jgi:hypothetical protein